MSTGWILIIVSLFVQWPTTTAQSSSLDPAGDRTPALYTRDFGNCMENSAITISRFDAAYYTDNTTIIIHIDGKTSLIDENLMIHLTVNAYGENRFNILFNPCNVNLPSLCPARSSVNISVVHAITVSTTDVSRIPAIAFAIPDLEGWTSLRILSNSTQRQVSCVTALITNGKTFSHPKIISPILGGLTFIICAVSFITAISGDGVTNSRSLYAHSLSAYTLFSCFHSIFFTGALSVNFPSVLVAFWSNFAWAVGLIKAEPMQNSLDRFTRRSTLSIDGGPDSEGSDLARELYPLSKRRFQYGGLQKDGLPIPGNFSGFPATLARIDLTATNAFMTAFLWFLVLLAGTNLLFGGLKLILETFSAIGLGKNRFKIFRDNWLAFLKSILYRTVLIAFFPIIMLAAFQFTLKEPGPQGISGILFAILVIGVFAAVIDAYITSWRGGRLRGVKESRVISLKLKFGLVPWCRISPRSSITASQKLPSIAVPWWKLSIETRQERITHEDEVFIRQFGWLSARFRRRRWWFFGPWLLYEFIKALFYGGVQGNPKAQVLGLLALEIITFGASAIASPFQSVRLNALMIYLFGLMKIATLAIIAALMLKTGLNRIVVTVLGIAIIAFQGVTALVVIIFGAANIYTTYFMIAPPESRIKPESCIPTREKYLRHVKTRSIDIDPPPRVAPEPVTPSFSVTDVRRYPKIDDEYNDDKVGSLLSGSSRRTIISGYRNSTAPRSSAPPGVRLPQRTWSPSPNLPNEDMISASHMASSRTDWALLNPPPASINNSLMKETRSRQARDFQQFETDVHTFPQKF